MDELNQDFTDTDRLVQRLFVGGKITSAGMQFWYGIRYIGEMARRQKKDTADVQGIVSQLAYRGDYVAWAYQTTSTGDYYTC